MISCNQHPKINIHIQMLFIKKKQYAVKKNAKIIFQIINYKRGFMVLCFNDMGNGKCTLFV